jgi:hypothetical protein
LILLYFGTGWLKIIPSLATGGRATPRQTNGWSIKTEEREREREREAFGGGGGGGVAATIDFKLLVLNSVLLMMW